MTKPNEPGSGDTNKDSNKTFESESGRTKQREFRSLGPGEGNDDGREKYGWKSRYELEAQQRQIFEAQIVGGCLFVFLICAAVTAGFAGNTYSITVGDSYVFLIDTQLLLMYFSGCLGGTTFSIKWLIHAVAKGYWNYDRFFWRIFVPFIGGIYAVVVLILMDSGLLGGNTIDKPLTIYLTGALAFLVGYFSDGVSGLLSNIANAVFGTVEKK